MKKMIITYYLTTICCIFLCGCYVPARYFMRRNLFLPNYAPVVIPTHDTLTIWVHGTRLFQRPPSDKLAYRTLPSLIPTCDISKGYHLRTISETLCAADPNRFKLDSFYHFCWSGKLCFQERLYAAQQLYAALTHLSQQYHAQHGKAPRIRLIAHSHGGNVCLNLALMCQDAPAPFTIDELILLACPVQDQTKHLVKNPLFKQIYVLYSALDLIQILDPQGFYKHKIHTDTLFSKRQFAHQANLAQMKIKVDRRAIMHSEFSHAPFLRLLPAILDEINAWQADIVFKQDPNKISRMLCVYTKRQRQARIRHMA